MIENIEKEELETEINATSDIQEENEADKEIEDLKDKLLRAVAESENIRKRYEKQLEDTRSYAIFNFAKDLITVMSNLTMALEHKPANITVEMQNIITGVELTKNILEKAFHKHGIEKIIPNKGDKFDYNLHHVISEKETDEYESGVIIDVLQMGYKIKDRLLDPSFVCVSKKCK